MSWLAPGTYGAGRRRSAPSATAAAARVRHAAIRRWPARRADVGVRRRGGDGADPPPPPPTSAPAAAPARARRHDGWRRGAAARRDVANVGDSRAVLGRAARSAERARDGEHRRERCSRDASPTSRPSSGDVASGGAAAQALATIRRCSVARARRLCAQGAPPIESRSASQSRSRRARAAAARRRRAVAPRGGGRARARVADGADVIAARPRSAHAARPSSSSRPTQRPGGRRLRESS